MDRVVLYLAFLPSTSCRAFHKAFQPIKSSCQNVGNGQNILGEIWLAETGNNPKVKYQMFLLSSNVATCCKVTKKYLLSSDFDTYGKCWTSLKQRVAMEKCSRDFAQDQLNGLHEYWIYPNGTHNLDEIVEVNCRLMFTIILYWRLPVGTPAPKAHIGGHLQVLLRLNHILEATFRYMWT